MSLLLASAIPFREEASASTTMVLFAFGITIAVLGLFIMVAVMGPQAGLVDALVDPAAPSGQASEPLVVEQMLPVSRETRVYVLRRGNERWLLSESTRSTSFTPVAALVAEQEGAAMTLVGTVAAAASGPWLETLGAVIDGGDFSPMLRGFVALTLLSFIPIALIGTTAFLRIIIVLSLLRHALGLQQTPPTIVLVSLAMFLTLFTMAPVMSPVHEQAIRPFVMEQIGAAEALERGYVPLRDFMVSQTREKDLAVVLEIAEAPMPERVEEIQAVHLIPAFMLSELRTAFLIGFVVFLPFLLIDLVVSAVLMALGMIMVPPTTLSLPLKILVFVLVDGWTLLIQALLASFSSG